jgi:hypothetical protein
MTINVGACPTDENLLGKVYSNQLKAESPTALESFRLWVQGLVLAVSKSRAQGFVFTVWGI